MKNLFLWVLGVAIAGMVGCSSTDGPTSTGGNTSLAYFPLTAGSNWTYNISSGTKKRVILGTSTYNGISYVQVADGEDTLSMRNNGTITYSLMPDTTLFTLQEVPIVNTVLGATWDYYEFLFFANAHVMGKTVATGLTRTVNGQTYTDVIQIHEDIAAEVFGTMDTARLDHYFAKGIGEIEIVDGNPATDKSATLVSYEIK